MRGTVKSEAIVKIKMDIVQFYNLMRRASGNYADLLKAANKTQDEYFGKLDEIIEIINGHGIPGDFNVDVQWTNIDDPEAVERVTSVRDDMRAALATAAAGTHAQKLHAIRIFRDMFLETWEGPFDLGGGRRRRYRKARKTQRGGNTLNMRWLTRRVNRLSLRNLQREENRLSEEEDHEMPGRGWSAKRRRRTHKRRSA